VEWQRVEMEGVCEGVDGGWTERGGLKILWH
jgi:hypothetical protein